MTTQYRIPELSSFNWQQNVKDQLSSPPGSPSKGDRYIIIAVADGDWTGKEGQIAWCSNVTGPVWSYDTPVTGWIAWDNDSNKYYYYVGSAWVMFPVISGLTSGRIPYSFGADTLTDSTNLTFDGTTTSTKGLLLGWDATNPDLAHTIRGVHFMRSQNWNYVWGDYFDEFYYSVERGATVTVTPTPNVGTVSNIFYDDVSSISWNMGTSPSPVVIEIDYTTPGEITLKSNSDYSVGITFRSYQTNSTPTHIKIEVWNGSAYSIVYDVDTTIDMSHGWWLSPKFTSPKASYGIQKLKITFTVPTPLGGNFYVQRVILHHVTAVLDPWHLSTGGGSVYGDLTLIGTGRTLIIPGSTSKRTFTVGTMGIQAYETNNVLLTDNMHYSSGWKRISTGYGCILYFYNGTIRLGAYGTGAAGSAIADPRTASQFCLLSDGNIGLGLATPTAVLHLKAGTSTASTAPLKFTSGTLLGTAEAGTVEHLTDKLYFTIATGTARKEIALSEGLTSGRVPYVTTNGRLVDISTYTFDGTTLTSPKFSGYGISPIGSVIAWLKSYTNTPVLPDGWVECNGQTLSDAGSVYNGQTIPDLNGNNYFLRGNATSGGVGGEETHVLSESEMAEHTHYAAIMEDVDGIPDVGGGYRGTIPTNDASELFTGGMSADTTGEAHENRPPYYDIVWIMRVK